MEPDGGLTVYTFETGKIEGKEHISHEFSHG